MAMMTRKGYAGNMAHTDAEYERGVIVLGNRKYPVPARYPVPAIREHFEIGRNLVTGEPVLLHVWQDRYDG
jgi:hypothetical protein